MTESDRGALKRLTGATASSAVSTDELQSLLLQVVFALLMVFMIAYFIFVEKTKKEQEEQVMELNRQKLVLALEKVGEEHRVKYGLNALMTQGTDGRRSFDAGEHIREGRLDLAPAAKAAFASGSAAALSDYSDRVALESAWQKAVLDAAELDAEAVGPEEMVWLEGEITKSVENVRLDARGVQRALAARLQQTLIENPELFGDEKDATAIAAAIKAKSLDMVKDTLGTEVLP